MIFGPERTRTRADQSRAVAPDHTSLVIAPDFDVRPLRPDEYVPSTLSVQDELPDHRGEPRSCRITLEPTWGRAELDHFIASSAPINGTVHAARGSRIPAPPDEGDGIFLQDGALQSVLRPDHTVWVRTLLPTGPTDWGLCRGAEATMRRALAENLEALEALAARESETDKTYPRPVGAHGTETLTFHAQGDGKFGVGGIIGGTARNLTLSVSRGGVRVQSDGCPTFVARLPPSVPGPGRPLGDWDRLTLDPRDGGGEARNLLLGTPGDPVPTSESSVSANQIHASENPTARLSFQAALVFLKYRDTLFEPAQAARARGEGSPSPPAWHSAFQKGRRLGALRLGPTVMVSQPRGYALPEGQRPDGLHIVQGWVAGRKVLLTEGPLSHQLYVNGIDLPVRLYPDASVQIGEIVLDASNEVLRGQHPADTHLLGTHVLAQLADFVREALSDLQAPVDPPRAVGFRQRARSLFGRKGQIP